MIVAFCDRCGAEIAAEVAAGVRYLFGKAELSGHLCPFCMDDARGLLSKFHSEHPLRVVRR